MANVDVSSECFILKPVLKAEALTLEEAAEEAGVARSTMRAWSTKHRIGRMIASRYMVSRVALAMFLDGDDHALSAYLSGDRSSDVVASYYSRFDILPPPSPISAS